MIRVTMTAKIGTGVLNLDGLEYRQGDAFDVSALTPDISNAKNKGYVTAVGTADSTHAANSDAALLADEATHALDADTADTATNALDSAKVNGLEVLYCPANISPAEVGAGALSTQDFAFATLEASDTILAVRKPTHQAGLSIVGGEIKAAGQASITFFNSTGAPITPTAAEDYALLVTR